jgi:multidrug efflux pump subunit AcrB
MSISTPFIRRPIATSLVAAAIFLVGLAAYPLLPVAPLPNVTFPTLTVTAQYPGASPETMASTVATPLETEFGQMLPGLSQMTSTSVLGTTQITLQFDLSTDLGNAETLLLEAMNAAQGSLPKNMPSPPTFRAVNPADSPIMILAMQSDQAPITDVDNYAENIVEQQLSQLPGVGQVLVGGQQTPAIRVQVDPARLAAMGMTMEDVRNVLTNVTVDDPKGSIDGPDRSYTIYNNDQLTTAAPYNKVIIAYRNGNPVRIGDIGRAVAGPQNRELAAWTNGKRSVLLLVFKLPTANVISTADGIKAKLPALEAYFPPDIHLNVVSDRTLTIRASVNDVEFTLVVAICLVVMVIFIFLRNVWATVIPSVTIPVALVGTLAVMYICGFSLDNLSLMALTIAVGFVVDDAIVMLENIVRHLEEGMRPLDAALKGAGEIGFTIVSISFSLIAVFIPLLLMGGIGDRVPHADADDGIALPQARNPQARAHLQLRREPVRRHAQLLPAHAGRGAALPVPDPARLHRDRFPDGLPLRHHPEGFLPDPGYRHHHRHHRGGAGCLLRPDGTAATGGERGRAEEPLGLFRGCLGGRGVGRADGE